MKKTFCTENHVIKILGDPSMANTDLKIIAWLLSCVVLGILLSVIFPDFDEEKINRQGRTRVRIECGRRVVRSNGQIEEEEIELIFQ